jgi:hypothetical protein
MPAIVYVIGAAAVATWIVALWSALNVIGLSPKGEKLTNYFRLGRLQFKAIEASAGPAVVPHTRRFGWALLAFLVVVIAGAAMTFIFAAGSQPA